MSKRAFSIKKDVYLRGRIGWQGLRAEEFTLEGPFLVTGTDFEDGSLNWDTCYHVSEARYAEAAYIHLRDEDVLVTKDGTIGKVAIVENCPDKAVLNSGVFLVRAKNRDLYPRYLYHVLRSDLFTKFLRSNLAGSTITHLYQYVFERFSFPKIGWGEQLAVASVLDQVDAAIASAALLVGKHLSMRSGLLNDLLTRGIDETGALRPSFEEAPELYHKTELGWLPKGWTAVAIDKLLADGVSMRSGPFGSALLQKELVNSGIPLLGIDNVFREEFHGEYRRFVTPEKAAELSRYRAFEKDVLITIMGTVGRSCVIPEGAGDLLSSKHVWTMTFDRSKVLPELVCAQLNYAPWVLAWFRREAQGGTMDAIQSSTLRRTVLPVPKPTEQEKILRVYEVHQRTLRKLQADVEKLRALRAGLMQDLLTGRRSVAPLLKERAA